MTQNWLKLRKCLFHHPKVMRVASVTGHCEAAVVGYLALLWSWADDATADGHIDCVTLADVQRVTQIPAKVLAAIVDVGWLLQTTKGIAFPDYENHMSSSAKNRATKAERQQKYRKTQYGGADVDAEMPRDRLQAGGAHVDAEMPRDRTPDKRREDKRREDKNTHTKRAHRPTLDEVREYFSERGTTVDPVAFWDYYESQGWKKANGQPVRDWRRCLTTWEQRESQRPRASPQTFHELRNERTGEALIEFVRGAGDG